MTAQLVLLFVWPLLVGVFAAFWAARQRTTRLALAIEFGVLTAVVLLRLVMDLEFARMFAALYESSAPFPWFNAAYLLVLYVSAGSGLVIGWRRGHTVTQADRQPEVAAILLAAIETAPSLDAAMSALEDYFEQVPDGLVAAVPALACLHQRDTSLYDATADTVRDRLAAAGFEKDLASELALVLAR